MNFQPIYRARDARKDVGDAVSFIPAAFIRYHDAETALRLNGRVVYVNEAHRFYTVEAACNGYKIRESFIF